MIFGCILQTVIMIYCNKLGFMILYISIELITQIPIFEN